MTATCLDSCQAPILYFIKKAMKQYNGNKEDEHLHFIGQRIEPNKDVFNKNRFPGLDVLLKAASNSKVSAMGGIFITSLCVVLMLFIFRIGKRSRRLDGTEEDDNSNCMSPKSLTSMPESDLTCTPRSTPGSDLALTPKSNLSFTVLMTPPDKCFSNSDCDVEVCLRN